ncbi:MULTISPECIES: GspH/FimT family pseudopilin [unclassified Moritella]|uniref:GspH/FimT family pseudopilin n=1 Tax=unclassified Moritella TaxID=2637987 RepID=UPI001BAA7A9C|nr:MULTISPECIES: GspH/FimT family pseudopilin [unclassified Moritella]QUM85868.1 GspH/FimT family pseudopilin [Moritella sp. 28]QUM90098.1 GspH/FimT family pseudopilin [Moritella sp. 36]
MKKSLGFTLIELMITIAIFAILIGIGVPSYQNTIQQSRIDDATTLINSALSYAKNTAIAHNRPLYMTAADNVLTLATSTAEIVNRTTIDTGSDSNLSVTGLTSVIIFRANGTITADNTIRYNPGGKGINITVSATGDTTVNPITGDSH